MRHRNPGSGDRGLAGQSAAAFEHLDETAKIDRGAERIAAREDVPQATLIIVAASAQDRGERGFGLGKSRHQAVDRLGQLGRPREGIFGIDPDRGSGERAQCPVLVETVADFGKTQIEIEVARPVCNGGHR